MMRRVKKEHKKVLTTLCELKDEHNLWFMAGAKKLHGLGLIIAI
jgi:hypothetical protein